MAESRGSGGSPSCSVPVGRDPQCRILVVHTRGRECGNAKRIFGFAAVAGGQLRCVIGSTL